MRRGGVSSLPLLFAILREGVNPSPTLAPLKDRGSRKQGNGLRRKRNSKGMNTATGDIIAYLDAGDYYSQNAFNLLLDVFSKASGPDV